VDVSTLTQKTLRDYERYLDANDLDWIDYEEPKKLDYAAWKEREDPLDPDTDA